MSALAAVLAVVMSLAVGNIKSNPTMPQPDVRHDTATLFRLDAPVVCANEVGPDRYRREFRRQARTHGYRVAGLWTSENPVATRWPIVSARVRLLSRGVKRISPDRTATVVVVKPPRGPRVAVVCLHLVSRAWTHSEASTALRRALWRQAVAKVRRIVAKLHNQGVAVVVAGDVNRPRPVHWGPRQLLLANWNLIQVALVPAPGQVARKRGGRMINTDRVYTDHPLIERRFALNPVCSSCWIGSPT